MRDATSADEPPPPNKELDNRDVCFVKAWNNQSCGQVVYHNISTFSAFAFPRGARHLPVRHAVRSLNQELGINHNRLAVTHTHTQQHAWQPGLWFFYMRGCSDFMWDMGRTLLVRNRCHLAVMLEQRAHRVKWTSAVMRVAKTLVLAANVSAWSPELHKLSSTYGVNAMVIGPLKEIVGSIEPDQNDMRTVTELARGLDRCARGNFSDLKSPASSIEQSLAGLNTLDYLSAALLMRDLANESEQEKLDTIQMVNMCTQDSHPSALADGLCTQPVELWDVRAITARWSRRIQADNASAVSVPRPWSSLNGSACTLSNSWPLCMSCRDSVSEQSCRYKCSQARRGKPSVLAPQAATRQTLLYGPAIRSDVYPIIDRQGALGKGNAWRSVWEKVVNELPRVSSPHRGMLATKSNGEASR